MTNKTSAESSSGDKTNCTSKLSLDELKIKIADPKTSKLELARYLLIDEHRSGPLAPALRPNPDTVDIPPDRAAVLGQIFTEEYNKAARKRRWQQFQETMDAGYDGPIVVTEGDSWFMFPWQFDIIDNLHINYDFAVRGVEAMGDTLQKMVNEGEYLAAIQETNASVLLLSGGGNDALGGGYLREHLRDFDPSLSASGHLLPSFYGLLDHAIALYKNILHSVEALSSEVVIICHGYDYAVPKNQRWLGHPMNEHDITDSAFQASIVRVMIDQFNVRLKQLIDTFSNARYLDLRGIVGPSRWFDELHPDYEGFADIAARFKAEIDGSTTSP